MPEMVSGRNNGVDAPLTPDVLERLVISRDPPSVSVIDLIEAVNLPWSEQMGRVFDAGACKRQ